MTKDHADEPRELLGMYADQVSDYAWRKYDRWLPHGEASPEAISALRAVLDECDIFSGRCSDVDDLIDYIHLKIAAALRGDQP
jgi:hypothetical protein